MKRRLYKDPRWLTTDWEIEEEARERIELNIREDARFIWNGTLCWLWTKNITRTGYAQMSFRGHPRAVHRLAYELFRGPIPEGLQIDHLCRVRHCVNPDHLEAVTARVNTLRSKAPSAYNATRKRCRRGHLFTPENTYVSKQGSRVCRTCVAAIRRAKSMGFTTDEVVAKDLRQRRLKTGARRPAKAAW